MPNKTVHCSICGQAFSAYDFEERMAKLRRHRKQKHPKAFQESYEKIRGATKHPLVKYPGKETGAREIGRLRLDPQVIKPRKRLIAKPGVVTFSDHKGQGLIRILHRENWTLFPEFALYVKLPPKGHAKHEENDEMLRRAGLTEENNSGKWVLRTNKFNLFVYV